MVAPLWALNTIKNCAPLKVDQSSPKNFRGCYPLRPFIIEVGQTSSEKVGGHWASDKIFFYFVTDSVREARLKMVHGFTNTPLRIKQERKDLCDYDIA